METDNKVLQGNNAEDWAADLEKLRADLEKMRDAYHGVKAMNSVLSAELHYLRAGGAPRDLIDVTSWPHANADYDTFESGERYIPANAVDNTATGEFYTGFSGAKRFRPRSGVPVRIATAFEMPYFGATAGATKSIPVGAVLTLTYVGNVSTSSTWVVAIPKGGNGV